MDTAIKLSLEEKLEEPPRLILVRWDKDTFWVLPYPHKTHTEQKVLEIIAKEVEDLIPDMRLFDKNEKPLDSLVAARCIVSHAAACDRRFWELKYKYQLSFSLEEIENFCREGWTFDDAVKKAKNDLWWWELVQCRCSD